jgi:hypothetical protein
VFRANHGASGPHQRNLDRLSKLTNVTGPRVVFEDGLRLTAPGGGSDAVTIDCIALENVSEQENVLPPIPQGRYEKRRSGDSEVEILTEGSLAHPTIEIAVGR